MSRNNRGIAVRAYATAAGMRGPATGLTVYAVIWLMLVAVVPVVGHAEKVGIDEKLGATIPADVQLNDESGHRVFFRQLVDKPTVLTLNYFRCAGICTPQLNNLVRTLNEVELEPGKDFQVTTVSFDPTDTPEMAAKKKTSYLKLLKRPFPPTAWRFLTGDAASTKALADAVGFQFKKDRDMYIHAGALIILSPGGKVTRYMNGITYLPADLEMAVREAASGLTRPTISKVLSVCFSYDPKSNKYVLNFTRIGGAVTLLLGAAFGLYLLLTGRRTERSRS
jgi:protein SCO1/2